MSNKEASPDWIGKTKLVDPVVEIAQKMLDDTKPGETTTLYLGGVLENSELGESTLKALEDLGVIDCRVVSSELSSEMRKKLRIGRPASLKNKPLKGED